MGTWAVMQGQVVSNVIVAEADFVAEYYPTAVEIDAVIPTPGVGWTLQGGKWSPPPVVVVSPSVRDQALGTLAQLRAVQSRSPSQITTMMNAIADVLLNG